MTAQQRVDSDSVGLELLRFLPYAWLLLPCLLSLAGRAYGHSYGHTLRWGYDFLRIDHIYVSPDIDVIDSFVAGGGASDHRPVVADLVLPP